MLYLIDKPSSELGLAVASLDPQAIVVLLGDGVFLDLAPIRDKEVLALREHVEERGARELLGTNARLIEYEDLVDLIVQHPLANFA